MLVKLFLLFVLVPLVELALLLWIGQYLGVLYTVGLVVLTAALGAGMARAQGMYVWYRGMETLREGKLPANSILDGILIFVAGVVFLTPGLITDLAGLLLLIPPVRGWVRNRLKSYLYEKIKRHGTVHFEFNPWS